MASEDFLPGALSSGIMSRADGMSLYLASVTGITGERSFGRSYMGTQYSYRLSRCVNYRSNMMIFLLVGIRSPYWIHQNEYA